MGMTREEKASMVSAFLVMTTSLYPLKLDFPVTWLSSTVAVALCTDRRWATQAFTDGIARASISISFITFTTWLIVGVPQIIGICAAKIQQVQDYQGYLVLVVALGSFHLNQNDDVAKGSGVGISQTYTGYMSASLCLLLWASLQEGHHGLEPFG